MNEFPELNRYNYHNIIVDDNELRVLIQALQLYKATRNEHIFGFDSLRTSHELQDRFYQLQSSSYNVFDEVNKTLQEYIRHADVIHTICVSQELANNPFAFEVLKNLLPSRVTIKVMNIGGNEQTTYGQFERGVPPYLKHGLSYVNNHNGYSYNPYFPGEVYAPEAAEGDNRYVRVTFEADALQQEANCEMDFNIDEAIFKMLAEREKRDNEYNNMDSLKMENSPTPDSLTTLWEKLFGKNNEEHEPEAFFKE